MHRPTHEFVTADLSGLKAALVARAQAERVSVSALVRRAVERELGIANALREPAAEGKRARLPGSLVKLSIRLTSAEAEQLVAGARHASLSRSAYLAGLLAGVPALINGATSRPDHLAALNASCAELSTLSRNLHHLTSLLRHGEVQAAMQYREMLDTLGADVREHLAMAAGLLAELRPTRVTLQSRPSTAA